MVAFGVVRIWGHGEIKPGLTELVDTIKKNFGKKCCKVSVSSEFMQIMFLLKGLGWGMRAFRVWY